MRVKFGPILLFSGMTSGLFYFENNFQTAVPGVTHEH